MPAQFPRGMGGPANASYDHKVTLWYFTLESRAIGFHMIFSAFGNFFVGKLPLSTRGELPRVRATQE